MSFRRGVRLGIDPGAARIGVARCDPDGILATPVTTVPAGPAAITTLVDLAREHEAIEILVGWPLSLDGTEGVAAAQAHEFAREISRKVTIPVRLVDERLTTTASQRALHAQGRNTRKSRSVIDARSAALIVQGALEYEKANSAPAGQIVQQN